MRFPVTGNNSRPNDVEDDMGPDRFGVLSAAPVASLMLILLVCVFPASRSASVGIRMPLLTLGPPSPHFTCDGRWVFVKLEDDGSTEVNSKPVPAQRLAAMVGKLMESQAERVVYLIPSPGVSYDRLVETFDSLRVSAADVHVGVLSRSAVDKYVATEGNRIYLPCDIVWPVERLRAGR